MAQLKNPPAMQETQVPSLDGKDTQEKEVATHSSSLAWRIPWTEEPAGYSLQGLEELDTTERITQQQEVPSFPLTSLFCSGIL